MRRGVLRPLIPAVTCLLLGACNATTIPKALAPNDMVPGGSGSGGDSTAPTVSITTPSASGAFAQGSPLLVTGMASDDVGVVSVQVIIGMAAAVPAMGTQSFSATLDTTTLAPGAYTVTVQASDAAGNVGTASVQITITTAGMAPTAMLSGVPMSPTNVTSIAVTVGGAGVTQYRYRLDGAAYSANTPVATLIAAMGLADGMHALDVVGGDASGAFQADAQATEVTWTIDTSKPTVTLTGLPPMLDNNPSPMVSVMSGGGVVTFDWTVICNSVRIDGATGVAVATVIAPAPLPDGSCSLAVTGYNALGTSNNATYMWTLDSHIPNTMLAGVPPNPTTLRALSVTVTATNTPTDYVYSLDCAGASVDVMNQVGLIAAPITASAIPDGPCTLTVAARDATMTKDPTPAIGTWTVNNPPTFPTPPASQTVGEGTGGTFTVVAAGSGALSYQWRKGGVPIGGATAASYTIASVTPADAGNYDVVVTNTLNATTASATSAAAVLTVNPKPSISVPPMAAAQVVGFSQGFSVTATALGAISYQWKKNGTPIGGATSSTYTIGSVAAGDAGTYTVDVTSTLNATTATQTSAGALLQVNTGAMITASPSDLTVAVGGTAVFSGNGTGNGTVTFQWYKGASPIGGATANTFTIPSVVAGDAGGYSLYVMNTIGAAVDTANTPAATLTVNIGPNISVAPSDLTRGNGQSATFSVTATPTGGGSLTYQWKKNGTPIGGATLNSYTIAGVAAADAATYSVDVINTLNTIPATTTSSAVLTFNPGATINTQPADTTAIVGGPAGFSVSASPSGGAALTYQWRKAGIVIPAATASSLSINPVAAGDAGTYTVDVINTLNGNAVTVTSAPAATLFVNLPPAISPQPSSQLIPEGTLVTFTSGATGNGTSITYQWQKDGTDIPGATNNLYTIASVAAGDVGNYALVATNHLNGTTTQTTSSAAALTMNPKPVINTQPVDSTTEEGQLATFTVSATFTGAASYQWQHGGIDIPGATTATLSIPSVAAADGGNYQVILENTISATVAQVTSNTAVLTAAPNTQLSGLPSNPQNGNSITVTVASPVGAAYRFSLTCAPPFVPIVNQDQPNIAVPISVGSIPDGPCMLTVTARTAGGVADPTPAVYGWVVDFVAPIITCPRDLLAIKDSDTISFGFDQPVNITSSPPIISGTALTFTSTPAGDGLSLALSPNPGPTWNLPAPHPDVSVTIQAFNPFLTSSTKTCTFDLVPAATAEIYLQPGHGGGDGSIGNPWGTLAAALTDATAKIGGGAPRAVIYASEGALHEATATQLVAKTSLYGGFVTGFVSGRDLVAHSTVLSTTATVQGSMGAPETTLRCTTIDNGTVIDGMTVAGPDGDLGPGTDFRLSFGVSTGCDAVLRHNTLEPPLSNAGEWWVGVGAGGNPGATVESNTFVDDGGDQRYGFGVAGYTGTALSVSRNVVNFTSPSGSVRMGISFDLGGAANGFVVANNTVNISNNLQAPRGIAAGNTVGVPGMSVTGNSITLQGVQNGRAFDADGGVDFTGGTIVMNGSGALAGVFQAKNVSNSSVTMTGTGTCVGVDSAKSSVTNNTLSIDCGAGGTDAVGVSGAGSDVGTISNNVINADDVGIRETALTLAGGGMLCAANTIVTTRSTATGILLDVAGPGPVVVDHNTINSGTTGISLSSSVAGVLCTAYAVDGNKVDANSVLPAQAVLVTLDGCATIKNNLVSSSAVGVKLDTVGGQTNASLVLNDTFQVQDRGVVLGNSSPGTVSDNILTGFGASPIAIDARISTPTAVQNNDIVGFTFAYEDSSLACSAGCNVGGLNAFGVGPPAASANISVSPQLVNATSNWAIANWRPANVPATCDVREGAIAHPRVPDDIVPILRTPAQVCVAGNGGDGTSMGAYEID